MPLLFGLFARQGACRVRTARFPAYQRASTSGRRAVALTRQPAAFSGRFPSTGAQAPVQGRGPAA
jgi:hypothetical protein